MPINLRTVNLKKMISVCSVGMFNGKNLNPEHFFIVKYSQAEKNVTEFVLYSVSISIMNRLKRFLEWCCSE